MLTATTTDAEVQAACAAGYALCKVNPPDAGAISGDGGAGDPCATVPAPPATCTATVDQYGSCVEEYFKASTFTYPPCQQLTRYLLLSLPDPGPGGGVIAGPACAAFGSACPGVPLGPIRSALKAGAR